MTSQSSIPTEDDIEKLFEDYVKNVPSIKNKVISAPPFPEENLMFNIFGQEKYLLISKYDLTVLPIKILRRLPIYLIKQFVVQVELDSLWYWALTHDIVTSSAGHRSFQSWSLKPAFETLMATHLANLGSAPTTPSIMKLNRVISEVVSQPVKDLVIRKQYILMYICYPVLEGLTKFAMRPLVDFNGRILTSFSDGRKTHSIGDRQISNLAVLLRSLENNALSLLSKPQLSEDLRDIRLQIEKTIPKKRATEDGWNSIYSLRNVSLHGAISWQLRSGLITNLICLIIWHLMDDQEINDELKNIVKRPSHFQLPFQYYPPLS
jgi:hypothetical protein